MMVSAVVTLVAVLSAAIADILPPQHGHRVVCYMGFEDYNLKFNSSDAEPALHLCTHLIFACAVLRELEIDVFKTKGFNAMETINNLVSMKKEKFPHLKILIGVGMIDYTTLPYSRMARTPDKRATFVQNMLTFLLNHNLDGIDIGWKYATNEFDFTNNNFNQVLLTKDLRQEFEKAGLLVSVAILTGVDGADIGIDTAGLAEHAHFLNIGSQTHRGFSVSVERHMNYGVPPDKINMAVFSMGARYNLDQDPVKDKKTIITKTYPTQLMAYSVLCKEMEKEGWAKDVDKETGLVSFGNKDTLVTIDNPVSTYIKISYVMNATLGGVTFRSLAGDDYRGECVGSDGKYPMLRDIDRRLVELAPDAYKDIFHRLEQNDASYFWNGMNET